jgi:hypothetical protein
MRNKTPTSGHVKHIFQWYCPQIDREQKHAEYWLHIYSLDIKVKHNPELKVDWKPNGCETFSYEIKVKTSFIEAVIKTGNIYIPKNEYQGLLTKEVEKYFLHEIMLYVSNFVHDMSEIEKNLINSITRNFIEEIKPNTVKKREAKEAKDSEKRKEKAYKEEQKKELRRLKEKHKRGWSTTSDVSSVW